MADMTYEEIQTRFCSNSRRGNSHVPGRMGERLVKTVMEAWPLFKGTGPILDVGCGDGLGMETFKELGATEVTGIEVSSARVAVARSFGLDVWQGDAAELLVGLPDRSYEIFCSHTLEHVQNRDPVMKEIRRVARTMVWISVPIERRGKSANKAHFSPVSSLSMMNDWFDGYVPVWKVVRLEQRFNLEPEGVLVVKRVV